MLTTLREQLLAFAELSDLLDEWAIPAAKDLRGGAMTTPTPDPFDPGVACSEPAGCPLVDPCTLRCHERFLNDEMQPNDAWADEENAAAWRRYYDANPGAEEASRAACDPKTYEEKA